MIWVTGELIYLSNLGLAALLSLIVGIERGYHQKQAGVITHTLVALGAALFMVISKYGFFDLSDQPGFSLDGSRIAAQIVSGVGFLGAGLIFVRRDSARGLTTAASIWLVAAIGTAAGAGMYLIAFAVVLMYLVVAFGIRPLTRFLPRSKSTQHALRMRYADGRGILREVVATVAEHGMKISNLQILNNVETEDGRHQDIVLVVDGSAHAVDALVMDLDGLAGVVSIGLNREDDEG